MGVGWKKKLQESQESPLKGPKTDLALTETHSLWASAPGQQLEGHSGIEGIMGVSGVGVCAEG